MTHFFTGSTAVLPLLNFSVQSLYFDLLTILEVGLILRTLRVEFGAAAESCASSISQNLHKIKGRRNSERSCSCLGPKSAIRGSCYQLLTRHTPFPGRSPISGLINLPEGKVYGISIDKQRFKRNKALSIGSSSRTAPLVLPSSI